jgi:uncharacterized protein YjiK
MATTLLKALLAAAACAATFGAQATGSINLGSYVPAGSYAIPALGGLGLEASAVTYARDRGTLFVVGDEGLGVMELSRTGSLIGTMSFDWAGTGSTHNDAEGLAYLGGGTLVVVDERPQIAYRFSFADGGSVLLNNQPKVAITGSTASVGNAGTEGISVDPRDGRFFTVKQDNPARLLGGTLSFAVGGGTSTMTTLFEGATSLFGLASLSDVQTLGGVDALAGHAAADNLLILSLDSKRLIEIDRAGNTLSSLDLSGLTTQALEGVTIDELGTIYLVAEDSGSGNSRLFVLTPVPEPGTYALMLSGLLALGWAAHRRRD